MESEPVGPADVQYNHWKGTVALDDPDDDTELSGLLDLDPELWIVVGLDFYGGDRSSWVTAYAVERSVVRDFEDFARLAEANGGSIPVTAFEIHPKGEPVENFGVEVLSLFKRWSIHARLTAAIQEPGYDLIVEQRRVVGDEEVL